MSVVVLQLNSKFKGSYYNINDEPVDFDGERPFYIWFMGSHKYLKNIFSKVNIGKLKGGSVQNIFVQIPEIEKLKYGLLRYPKKEISHKLIIIRLKMQNIMQRQEVLCLRLV